MLVFLLVTVPLTLAQVSGASVQGKRAVMLERCEQTLFSAEDTGFNYIRVTGFPLHLLYITHAASHGARVLFLQGAAQHCMQLQHCMRVHDIAT